MSAELKIITHHVFPPIPIRQFDWAAYREGYDADCDEDGYFSHCLVGRGATEQAAIADLLLLEAEHADA